MFSDNWREIMLRVTPRTPDDLDDLTAQLDQRVTGAGKSLFPTGCFAPQIFKDALRSDVATIGIRLPKEDHTAHDIGLRMCALGQENEAEVIVLTDSHYSGVERFGFRTESIRGETEEQRQENEEQLLAFWDLNLIL